MSDVQDLYKRRLTTPDLALRDLPPRLNLLLGMFVAQPPALIQAFVDRVRAGAVEEARVYYMHSTRRPRRP